MTAWKPAELKKLAKIYDSKPAYVTDYELAGRISSQFHKSPESVRWQLRQLHREPVLAAPKILLLDIETLPIEAKVFDTYKVNISPHNIKKDWSVACWSAKWLFDKESFGQVVKPEEAVSREDFSILPKMWEALNEAEIVITQNGDNFDLKRLNTRFLIYGFPRPLPYLSIDTLKVLKDNFSFTYNGMDWVASVLGIGRKVQTSFKWWDECSEGNKKYLRMMLDYNMQDVQLLEELYLKLRPWMKGHPNLNLYSVQDVCPTCGSFDIKKEGHYATPMGLYESIRCQLCGSLGRRTKKEYKIAGAKLRSL